MTDVAAFVASIALGLGIGLTWAEAIRRTQAQMNATAQILAPACTCLIPPKPGEPWWVHAPACPKASS